MKASSDVIFDAAIDDGLFLELSRLLGEELGGRSCTLH